MPPRRRADFLKESALREDEEIKRTVQELETRLTEEEEEVEAEADRSQRQYVIRQKFLDEIAGKIVAVERKLREAIIKRDSDYLSTLRGAWMELGEKVKNKVLKFEDAEIKRTVQELKTRLQREEDAVHGDAERNQKQYVIRRKFLNEIASKMKTVNEKLNEAILPRETENLTRLQAAWLELSEHLLKKVKIFQDSLLIFEDVEIERAVQELKTRLQREEDAVNEDADRREKQYVIRYKFLNEIGRKIEAADEKLKKASIPRETENLSRLRAAWVELGQNVSRKMKIFQDSKLAESQAEKNIGKHLGRKTEEKIRMYQKQISDEEAARVERENEANAAKQQRIAEMHENITFSTTKSRTYKQMAEETRDDKEKLWFLKLQVAYGEEAVRTRHELKEFESGEKAFVWNINRPDVKAWIDEYWKRCHTAYVRDEMMKVLTRERSEFMDAKQEIIDRSARSAVRTLKMNQEIETLTTKVKEVDEKIDYLLISGVGGDAHKVIVAAPPTIEMEAKAILGRFELLLLTRREHIEQGQEHMSDFDGVSDNLMRDMQSHLRYVERQYDIQEKARPDVTQQAAAGPARRAAAGDAGYSFSTYVQPTEAPRVLSLGARRAAANTAAAWDGNIYWCLNEINVTVFNGHRREGTACKYTISMPEGRSLFAEINDKVPFYDWARVGSKSFVLDDKDVPPELEWKKAYGDPTDEMDCMDAINEFGRRTVANKDVTHCHLHLYRISRGF